MVITDSGSTLVDGRELARSNWMRYINYATSGEQHNLRTSQRDGAVYYRTCRPVAAFDELLLMDETGEQTSESTTSDGGKFWPREVHACQECGECFSSEFSLQRHIRLRHTQRSSGASETKYAVSQVPSPEMRAPVPVPKPFVCDICDKVFSRRAYLDLHGKTHAQARSHECATCGQRFNNLSNLLRHEKLHSSDSRPHVCPHCGKCYARKDYLNVHLATHKEERQYKCGKCERAFSDRRNLKRHHDVVHEKMYPFKCPDCGKGFASRRDGQRHVRTHHARKGDK
ncbi:hypothetical protein MTO96_004966 [Rhipicephalus appendiculatus]